MREILKEVVNEQGLQILQTPAMLRAKLEEKGDDRSDALLWELILTACQRGGCGRAAGAFPRGRSTR